MANNAEAARARRERERTGAKKLGPITVTDPKMWAEILHEANVVPPFVGKELTEAQLRDATQKLILEMCRARRREQAEAMLAGTAKIRTGLIEREPPPDTEEQAIGWRPSGDHWSFRTGQKKDKGRTYTGEELDEFLESRPDLQDEITDGGIVQDLGMRIIGGAEE
jgi:hypothetical protein